MRRESAAQAAYAERTVVPRDASETRIALLDTAEELMAAHGPEGVSMREISARSGQGNNNAAQYHFGSAEGLIEAVLERRMGPIAERRAAMIAELSADPTMTALARAIVVPLAEASRRHPEYPRFFAQLRLSRRYGDLVRHSRIRTSSFQDVRDQIDSRLDHLDPTERNRRRWLCATLVIHTVAEFVADRDAQPHESWDELVDGVVAACVRVLEG